jgi:hypothetical protein
MKERVGVLEMSLAMIHLRVSALEDVMEMDLSGLDACLLIVS